ncbi:hypothetical protein HYW87_00815 [Candidatus Roizmanbacteria bacterium]|nr:hypothetical protein [Candidatus Roizmanbacteria bacterium]
MPLQHIIPSKARRKILELFFQHPTESFYLRLDILSEEKVLHKERRLNKIFYTLNKHYSFYDEFLRIFSKMSFLPNLIYKNLSKIGKIKFIAMSMKFAKRIPIKEDEIYLLLVGVIVVPEMASIIAETEKQYGTEINYTVMTEDELAFRKKNNDPFIWRFLRQPKIMLVGFEEELMK